MHVSLETLDGLKRRLTIQLPAEQFDSAYQQRLQSLAKSAKVDGFRKGKVPMKIIQQRYSASVKQEILTGLIQRSYDQAIRQENLKPAGAPLIDSKSPEPGEGVRYTAIFEVWPEFELADLSKVSIVKPVVDITETDIGNTMEKLREQRSQWQPVKRAARHGDQIKIDFDGTIAGEPFEGGQGTGVTVVLGEAQMMDEIESGLEGISAEEHRSIHITFPDNYPQESLRGNQAVIEIACKQVAEKHLPELNEDFVRSFDIEDGSLDTLRTAIRRQLESELNKGVRAFLREQVMTTLINLHDMELPQTLVEMETNRLQQETAQRLGLNKSVLSKWPHEEFEKRARRRVHLRLIVARLVNEKNIQVDQQAVLRKIEETVIDYQDPEEMRRYYLSNRNAMQHFKSLALEERVIDQVVQDAQTIDKVMRLEELMQAARS